MSLKDRLASLAPRAFEGKAFRLVHERFRDALLSTEGSLQLGGRYNPPQTFGALYLAESEALARREVLRAVGDPSALAAGFVCGELEVRLGRVLDLTDPEVLKALGLEHEALLADTGDRVRDYTLTRRVAALARGLGFAALRAPSVTSGGANLVVFPENLTAEDRVEVRRVRKARWESP